MQTSGNNTLVIITGSTKGLGKELLSCFNNYDTYCLNRTHNTSNKVHQLDLSKPNIAKDLKVIKEKASLYSNLIYINNASTISPVQEIKEISLADIDISTFTNYINPAKIIHTLLQLKKQTIILNLTSGAAFTTNTKLALYSSSKAAMHRFIDILAEEEKNNNNILLIENFDPGRMNTDMQVQLLSKKNIPIKTEELMEASDIASKIFKHIHGVIHK